MNKHIIIFGIIAGIGATMFYYSKSLITTIITVASIGIISLIVSILLNRNNN
ncbi:MAG: hypothetical protein ABF289_13585 [Clostridiales bacterium]